MRRGRHAWLPKDVACEIEDIMQEDKKQSFNEGLRSMAKYAEIGREVNRLWSFKFSDAFGRRRKRK